MTKYLKDKQIKKNKNQETQQEVLSGEQYLNKIMMVYLFRFSS